MQYSKSLSSAAVSGSPQGRAEAGETVASPYRLDRLFLTTDNAVPFNMVLSFNSAVAVENFFGVGSAQAKLATEYFSGNNGPWDHMLFDRMPLGGGRARIFGANLSGLTLSKLRAINGTLSLTSEGYNFNASINLAGATSFESAASLIQSALNAAQPTVATTTGSTVTPGSASFTGSIEGGVMVVTAVSSGKIAIGGRLTSANGYAGQIIYQESGTPGGVGVYNVFYGTPSSSITVPPGTALSESYGILTIGAVNFGTVAAGQEVAGSGVAADTAIGANISGSGDGSQWVVNLTQTVASEALSTKAAPLQVTYHYVTGATRDSNSFWIEVNGAYPVLPTTMTYAKGTAAASLGLTPGAGAYLSTPGRITTSPYAWLNNIVQQDSQWSSFQMTFPTAPDTAEALSDWSAASDGRFKYLKGYTTTTPPAGSVGARAPALAQPGYYVPTASASSETPDDPGYYRPYEGVTAETIDGHRADLLGSASVTDMTPITQGGWKQLIDQDFAGAGAAQSYFDHNIASAQLLLSPGAAATTLDIGVTVPSVTPGSGLYGDLPTPSADDRFLALLARSWGRP
jgi:Protein of unknown function (DUF3383)